MRRTANASNPKRRTMWRIWRMLSLLALMSGLTGCLTIVFLGDLPDHRPPAPDVPAAKLLLRTYAKDNIRSLLALEADNDKCTWPEVLARSDSGQETAARVAAGKLITLLLLVEMPDKVVCGARISFTPEAGKTYSMRAQLKETSCTAIFLDTTRADQTLLPADVLLRSAPGQGCVPLASAPKAQVIPSGQHHGEAVLNPDTTAEDLKGLTTR